MLRRDITIYTHDIEKRDEVEGRVKVQK